MLSQVRTSLLIPLIILGQLTRVSKIICVVSRSTSSLNNVLKHFT